VNRNRDGLAESRDGRLDFLRDGIGAMGGDHEGFGESPWLMDAIDLKCGAAGVSSLLAGSTFSAADQGLNGHSLAGLEMVNPRTDCLDSPRHLVTGCVADGE